MLHDDEGDGFGAYALVLLWLAAFVFSAIYLNGCVRPPPPPTEVDGGAGDCAAAADRLELLGCVGEETCSIAGDCDGFEERCGELERDLPGILNTPCLASAADCAAADRCAEGVQ